MLPYEQRLLADIRLMLERWNDLEDRYYSLTKEEFEEYCFIEEKLPLFSQALLNYKKLFKSS